MNQADLRDQLATHFDNSELSDLCFDLNINFQNIPGQTNKEKARELIIYCQRHGLLEDLINRCQKLRPQLSWKVDEHSPSIAKEKQRGKNNASFITCMIVGFVIIITGCVFAASLIQNAINSATSSPVADSETFIESTDVTTATLQPLPSSVESTATPSPPLAPSLPVELPDGATVMMIDSTGSKYQYTILSAERESLPPDKYLLRLRIRAWTDSLGGMNFWSDSFRLVDNDLRLAPVNSLNELAKRDETIDGDVEFEIEPGLTEAILVITVGGKNFAGNTKELRLLFP